MVQFSIRQVGYDEFHDVSSIPNDHKILSEHLGWVFAQNHIADASTNVLSLSHPYI